MDELTKLGGTNARTSSIGRRAALKSAAGLTVLASLGVRVPGVGAQSSGDQVPMVVTDPAKAPSSFKEAPELASQVAAGKLPKVAERVGADPLVLAPTREIGR